MSRWIFVSLLSLAGLIAVGARATARGDDAALRRELDELRAEKNALQDQAIELARRFDLEKRRLMEEKEQAQRRAAQLERDLRLAEARAGAKPAEGEPAEGKPAEGEPAEGKPAEGKPDALDQQLSLSFDGRRLPDCATLLRTTTGVRVALEPVAADPVVHLRVGRMSVRAILDLLVLNIRDGSGKLLEGIRWREVEGGVVIEPKR